MFVLPAKMRCGGTLLCHLDENHDEYGFDDFYDADF
jgi:hypothetical protein